MNTFWNETIQIGSLTIPRFMAAPLDGVTNSPFRQIVRIFSPGPLLFTEMRHVAHVVHEKTNESLDYDQCEQPLCFQISANSQLFIDKAIEKITTKPFNLLNLNIACPAPNTTRSGSGAALMNNISMLKKVLAQLTSACKEKISFSIKMRAGFKENNGLEVACIAEQMGAACIIIHPRTASQHFSGALDFKLVKKIKETLSIPVIFSGNITSFQDAQRVYELTNADGYMIGRALIGAPWNLHKIMQQAQGKPFSINLDKIFNCFLQHLIFARTHPATKNIHTFKQHLSCYFKNFPHAAQIRHQLMTTLSYEELYEKLIALQTEKYLQLNHMARTEGGFCQTTEKT